VDHQVGEPDLPDGHLLDRPLVGVTGPPTPFGHPPVRQHVVPGGVVEPGARIHARDDAAQIDDVGHRPVVDQDVQQCPADLFGLERGIEVQHDPARTARFGERDQRGQQVLAQGARQAAVHEPDRGGDVVGPTAQPPAGGAGADAEFVLTGGRRELGP